MWRDVKVGRNGHTTSVPRSKRLAMTVFYVQNTDPTLSLKEKKVTIGILGEVYCLDILYLHDGGIRDFNLKYILRLT